MANDKSAHDADIKQQSEQTEELDIRISMPPVISGAMRQAYVTGCKRYEREARLKNEEPDEEGLSKYCGALELIKRGYVHVSGLDKLAALLGSSNYADVDSASDDLIAFLVIKVARPFEDRFRYPLVWKVSLS